MKRHLPAICFSADGLRFSVLKSEHQNKVPAMAPTVTTFVEFIWLLVQLRSFPLFLAYLCMVASAGLWQKWTTPVNLRYVLVVYNLGMQQLQCCHMCNVLAWNVVQRAHLRQDTTACATDCLPVLLALQVSRTSGHCLHGCTPSPSSDQRPTCLSSCIYVTSE
ncbi:hypothetical protein LSAT2_003000 [Lamellibrachia satsuma]|nr:hypothetical protein LSAT2_003000 [Lamellibrachia satsuma]